MTRLFPEAVALVREAREGFDGLHGFEGFGIRAKSFPGPRPRPPAPTRTFAPSGTRCAAWLYRPEGPGPHPAW